MKAKLLHEPFMSRTGLAGKIIDVKHIANDVYAWPDSSGKTCIYLYENEIELIPENRAAESGAEPVQCLTNKGQNTGSVQ